MKTVTAVILAAFAFTIFTITTVKSVSLKQHCTGYLKRAADANTIETAREELQRSIQYLEANNLTKGYTSVFWKTPDEDIEFWYKNLKASERGLSEIDSTASTLERTNVLMKLRETLMDSGENNDRVTVPEGLSKYPNNGMWGALIWLSILIIFGLIIWAAMVLDKHSKAAIAKESAIK